MPSGGIFSITNRLFVFAPRFPYFSRFIINQRLFATRKNTMQHTSSSEHKHKKFIERAVESEIVWGMASDEGYALCESREFEETKVLPFWSDKAFAIAVNNTAWSEYQPKSMALPDFLENFLIGMYNEGYLVGTNWDADMNGKECEPLELALEISTELVTQGKELPLKKYQSVQDFHQQVKNAVETE